VRVLVLSSTFPQYPDDPRGRFILRHWEARAARGDTVRFLVPDTAWVRGDLASACEVVRFRYAPHDLSSLTGRFGILENIRDRPWRALLVPPFLAALRSALQSELRRFQPDRIAAHMFAPCGLVAAPLARAAGLPCELHGHGTDIDLVLALPAPLRHPALRSLLAADRLSFPSRDKLQRFTAALGLAAPPPHCHVDTMNRHARQPTRPPIATASDTRDVLFVGRLIKQKGVADLLAAAALMHTLAAPRDRRRRPRAPAPASHGRRPPASTPASTASSTAPRRDALYRRAALLCVPSREVGGLSEGAPLVIAEARRFGLPVVATAVGGIPELMRDLYPGAALVRPNAPEALARALERALEPRLRSA
jgi:glycosyltransferase involved in cell wall biosynthesis